ncbi:carbamate kinase [Miltoncostaea marina]|uniref:carbamate kinase n=1 Tax=Miltoncostaea marina TaxID=2843215 RepID=UPI001C3D6EB8|nr:carbamate kinase [Miltoncostaea marina]
MVLAIGGNALAPAGLGDFDGQMARAREVAVHAARIVAGGARLLIVHGNGPQVGALAMAQEAVAREVPPQPLFALGAMTQGQLGYLLAQAVGDALAAEGAPRSVAAVMTQVVVDRSDAAFGRPTKPIGPFFPEGRARRLADARGWAVAEDSGRGWRRVVPSPDPVEIVEAPEIARLLEAGEVVVACGGGGVPVVRDGEGLAGVDAVIDKDLAAALVGGLVGATTLLLVTGVDHVLLDFGTPDERPVASMTVAEARAHLADGQFPPGSMGPKIDAAARFAEASGGAAVVTSLERVEDALAGRAGTRIVAL